MVARVVVHIGLPKTATSYLQTIMWSNRDRLRKLGVVVPGDERRDHLWASRTVREDRHQADAPERHRSAWARICAELAASSGTGLISHEFFAAASAQQAATMVSALPTDNVEIVVTAREPLGLFTASWQESLKNGSSTPMPDYCRRVSAKSTVIWNWRTLDLRLVLERWAAAVAPARTHVLVLDPAEPREAAWDRFADIVGCASAQIDLSGSFPNRSMGVVEAETLRRMNESRHGFVTAFDKGVYIRSFVADERLVPRGGDRFWPEPEQIEECRRRGDEAIAYLGAHDYDVVGDVENLRVPAELEPRRSTSSVSEAEVAEVAIDLARTLLADVRRLRRRRQSARRPRWRARLSRLRQRLPAR